MIYIHKTITFCIFNVFMYFMCVNNRASVVKIQYFLVLEIQEENISFLFFMKWHTSTNVDMAAQYVGAYSTFVI